MRKSLGVICHHVGPLSLVSDVPESLKHKLKIVSTKLSEFPKVPHTITYKCHRLPPWSFLAMSRPNLGLTYKCHGLPPWSFLAMLMAKSWSYIQFPWATPWSFIQLPGARYAPGHYPIKFLRF